jgi:hypothetical protein
VTAFVGSSCSSGIAVLLEVVGNFRRRTQQLEYVLYSFFQKSRYAYASSMTQTKRCTSQKTPILTMVVLFPIRARPNLA